MCKFFGFYGFAKSHLYEMAFIDPPLLHHSYQKIVSAKNINMKFWWDMSHYDKQLRKLRNYQKWGSRGEGSGGGVHCTSPTAAGKWTFNWDLHDSKVDGFRDTEKRRMYSWIDKYFSTEPTSRNKYL